MMVEIGKLHWLSVLRNCCQSFGWLYLAVLNVAKLFCSLLLLWHEWQCIALVNNGMLVWFNSLLNSLLSATHKTRRWQWKWLSPTCCTLLCFITCVSQKDRILSSPSPYELKWGEINPNKKPSENLCFFKKLWVIRERLKPHASPVHND